MQLEFFDVPSPCIDVCQSDDKGYCLGCMRTREERKDWKKLDVDNKQKIIKRCIQRKKRKEKKNKHETVEMINHVDDNQIQPSLLESVIQVKRVNEPEDDLDFGDFEL
ncbi:MAG: DUF1289 domain-containing protein [Colwellia sp.]|jgi:Predicted Fe-S protein